MLAREETLTMRGDFTETTQMIGEEEKNPR